MDAERLDVLSEFEFELIRLRGVLGVAADAAAFIGDHVRGEHGDRASNLDCLMATILREFDALQDRYVGLCAAVRKGVDHDAG